jgi:Carboxypeptidase regulatory-like domain
MRITSTVLVLLGLLGAAMQAPPPPAPPAPPPRIAATIPETGDASIGGLVRRLDTGEPIATASVDLLGLPERSGPFAGALSIRQAKTDADGRFVFEKPPPSTYTVRVGPTNFFPPPIGGTSDAAATASVTVDGGQRVPNLSFNLVPGGVIHGLIRDDEIFRHRVPFDGLRAMRILSLHPRGPSFVINCVSLFARLNTGLELCPIDQLRTPDLLCRSHRTRGRKASLPVTASIEMALR